VSADGSAHRERCQRATVNRLPSTIVDGGPGAVHVQVAIDHPFAGGPPSVRARSRRSLPGASGAINSTTKTPPKNTQCATMFRQPKILLMDSRCVFVPDEARRRGLFVRAAST